MRFAIHNDAGHAISGWILPDNPSVSPKLIVVRDDEVLSTVPANIMRPQLQAMGLHDTGRCGFVVTERNAPGVTEAADLELYDDETGVRIYRRRPKDPVVEDKLFRLELQLLRNASLNASIEQRFHMGYTGMEWIPEETARSIMGIAFSGSIYITGRVPLRSYDAVLRNCGFKLCCYLRDPVEELAEQLLIAQWAIGGSRNSMRGALAREFLDLLDSVEPPELRSWLDFETWLADLPKDACAPLCDPATRLLIGDGSEERAEADSLARALDALSGFSVVGLKSELPAFVEMLEGTLACDLALPEPSPGAGRVAALAEHLRGTEIVQELLEIDLQLYAAVEAAYRAATSSEAGDQQARSRIPVR